MFLRYFHQLSFRSMIYQIEISLDNFFMTLFFQNVAESKNDYWEVMPPIITLV